MPKNKEKKENIYYDDTDIDLTDTRPSYVKKRVIVPCVMAVLFLAMGIYFIIHSLHYQKTDDAFVEGHIITIAPRIQGPVLKLLVDDNEEVKEGQLLLEIDPNDYITVLKQKQAELDEAKASLNITEKEITHSTSELKRSSEDITAAKSRLNFANADYKRYSEMYKEGISSKQEYDDSKTRYTVAKAEHKSAVQKELASESILQSSKAKKQAALAKIKKLEAEVEQAKLNLSYTKIYAPKSGLITNRSVEQGNYVQTAQPMLSIVPEKVWVVANFKETQLADMKKGQEVLIKIDTYPNKKFKGEVDSIQRATGAKASLFPPENAVGSYVKIVQRVPVKIVFKEYISGYNIVPGMSVVPEVKIKD